MRRSTLFLPFVLAALANTKEASATLINSMTTVNTQYTRISSVDVHLHSNGNVVFGPGDCGGVAGADCWYINVRQAQFNLFDPDIDDIRVYAQHLVAPDPGEAAPGTQFVGLGIDDIPLVASGTLGPVMEFHTHPLAANAPPGTPIHTDWLQIIATPLAALGPTDYRITIRLDHVLGTQPPPPVRPVPEPSSPLIFMAGLLGVMGLRNGRLFRRR
jgi:hypothetical protein